MVDILQVEESLIRTGFEIFDQIAAFQPFSSISFLKTDRIQESIRETQRLVDWGMAKNKPKMKEAALMVIDQMMSVARGDHINMNLDDYQLKSLAEVSSLLERALENKITGLELTRELAP